MLSAKKCRSSRLPWISPNTYVGEGICKHLGSFSNIILTSSHTATTSDAKSGLWRYVAYSTGFWNTLKNFSAMVLPSVLSSPISLSDSNTLAVHKEPLVPNFTALRPLSLITCCIGVISWFLWTTLSVFPPPPPLVLRAAAKAASFSTISACNFDIISCWRTNSACEKTVVGAFNLEFLEFILVSDATGLDVLVVFVFLSEEESLDKKVSVNAWIISLK